LLPILDQQVQLHATSSDAVAWGYRAVDVTITLAFAAAAAFPPAFVLGRRLRRVAIPWIAASAAGALVAFLIGGTGLARDLLGAPATQALLVLYALKAGVLSGGLVGIAQALVLRQLVRGSRWWMVASIFAYAIANVVSWLVKWQIVEGETRPTTNNDFLVEVIVGGLLWSLIVGLVTGWMLVRLLGESNLEPAKAVV